MMTSVGSWAQCPMAADISTSVTFRVPPGRYLWLSGTELV